MKAIISGLINIETTAPIDCFPIDYCPIHYLFGGISSNVSGVGCNISKALCTLGDDVSIISIIGNDVQGKMIKMDFDNFNINTEMVYKDLENTPTSVILYDKNGKRQVYCDLKDIQTRRIAPENVMGKIKDADVAVLCNIGFNRDLIKAVHDEGILTATDVHVLSNIDDDYNRDFMANADILFLSDEHLPCSPEDFIRQLYNRYHNKIIVIGMGSKGAMLFDSATDTIKLIPAYKPEKIVNTVGAGDALFSSFIHFYLKGHSTEDALKRAVIFAGIKIGFNGASIGFADESVIEKLLK